MSTARVSASSSIDGSPDIIDQVVPSEKALDLTSCYRSVSIHRIEPTSVEDFLASFAKPVVHS